MRFFNYSTSIINAMRFLIIFLILFLSFIVKGQSIYSNYILRSFDYGSLGTAIMEYNDTVYIQGEGGQTIDYRDLFIAKLDTSGQFSSIRKIQIFPNVYYSARGGLIKTSQGLFTSGIVCRQDGIFGYLYVLDESFNIIDSLYLAHDNFYVQIFSMVKTLDSCFALCGYLVSPPSENRGIILYKIDSNLNLLWTRIYKPSVKNYSFNLLNTPDNGFLISGMKSDGMTFSMDPLVIKTDNNGIEQWSWDDGSAIYDDGPAAISIDQNGGYFISYAHGIYQSTQWPPLPSKKRIRLVKLDNNGQEQWSRFFGTSSIHHWVNNMLTTRSNESLVNFHTSLGDCEAAALLKTSSVGDSIWLRYYIHKDSIGSINEITHFRESDENGFMTIGANYDPGEPGVAQAIWIMHLDSLGCQTPECNPFVGVKDNVVLNVSCYPNPASRLVTFKIPQPGKKGDKHTKVKASVYTRSGNFIESYICGLSEEVTLDIAHLSTGIYYITFIIDEDFVGTSKLLKL